jgi:hypothetical protein
MNLTEFFKKSPITAVIICTKEKISRWLIRSIVLIMQLKLRFNRCCFKLALTIRESRAKLTQSLSS